jgi:ABC-type multidrug transport system permease subunit
MLWVAVVTAGIVAGFWMASMTYYCGLCVFAPPRFAAWESCLVGCAVSTVLFGAIIALDREFVPSSVRGIRQVYRFLFEDLAGRQTN